MKFNLLKALSVIVPVTLLLIGCRPTKRPARVVGKKPTLQVAVNGMSNFGAEGNNYLLKGCLTVPGEISIEKQSIFFKHSSLKKGLSGCYIEVASNRSIENIKFTGVEGVYWQSDEFTIARNVEGELFATTRFNKRFIQSSNSRRGSSPIGVIPPAVKLKYNLALNLQLPDGVDLKKLSSFSGSLKCSEPVGLLNKEKLEFNDKLVGQLWFSDLNYLEDYPKLSCSKIKVQAMIGEQLVRFSYDLKDKNEISLEAGKTFTLNNGVPYLLTYEGSQSLAPGEPIDSIGVEIEGQCKEPTPYLNPVTYSCEACPTGQMFNIKSAECVQPN